MNAQLEVYAAGIIVSAIIAGCVSFLVFVLSKEQKTSEFRQAWIDGLRDDIAELVALFLTITSIVRNINKTDKSAEEKLEYILNKDNHFLKMEMVETKIKLRLNPIEHQSLIHAIDRIDSYILENMEDIELGDEVAKEIVSESGKVLKYAWERVKSGEPTYYWTKWISFTVFIVMLAAGAIYALQVS